jgi:hypothetical protein
MDQLSEKMNTTACEFFGCATNKIKPGSVKINIVE